MLPVSHWSVHTYQCVLSRSVMSDSLQHHGLWAFQAPLSMEFSRREYWSSLQFPTLGDHPDQEIESAFLVPPALAGRFFISATCKAPHICLLFVNHEDYKLTFFLKSLILLWISMCLSWSFKSKQNQFNKLQSVSGCAVFSVPEHSPSYQLSMKLHQPFFSKNNLLVLCCCLYF